VLCRRRRHDEKKHEGERQHCAGADACLPINTPFSVLIGNEVVAKAR
jgi:hypothetical protein